MTDGAGCLGVVLKTTPLRLAVSRSALRALAQVARQAPSQVTRDAYARVGRQPA